ncbi:MAG: hypothetical protein LW806_02955 [Planctomycetaceae bacterium]|nr:hypothetical protein [Planctomycetaceae bacterium]
MSKKPAMLTVQKLAEQLGVTSADIVNRCKQEGVPDIADGRTKVSPGLALTLREWFAHAVSVGTTPASTPDPARATQLPDFQNGFRGPLPPNSIVIVLDLDSLWEFADRTAQASTEQSEGRGPRSVRELADEIDADAAEFLKWCQRSRVTDVVDLDAEISAETVRTLRARFAIDTGGGPDAAHRNADSRSRVKRRARIFDLKALRNMLEPIRQLRASVDDGSVGATVFIPVLRESAWSSQFELHMDGFWSLPIFAPEIWSGPQGKRSEAISCGSAATTAALVAGLLAENESAHVLLVSPRFAESELRTSGGRLGFIPWSRSRLTLLHFGLEVEGPVGPAPQLDWLNPARWPPVVDASVFRSLVFVSPQELSALEVLDALLRTVRSLMARLATRIAEVCRHEAIAREQAAQQIRESCRLVAACEVLGFACETILSATATIARGKPAGVVPARALRAMLLPMALAIRSQQHVSGIEPLIHACWGLLSRVARRDVLDVDLGESMQLGYRSTEEETRAAMRDALVAVATFAQSPVKSQRMFRPLERNLPGAIEGGRPLDFIARLVASTPWKRSGLEVADQQLDAAIDACWGLSDFDQTPSTATVHATAHANLKTLEPLLFAAIGSLLLVQSLQERGSLASEAGATVSSQALYRLAAARCDGQRLVEETAILNLPPERLARLATRYRALCAALATTVADLQTEQGFPSTFTGPHGRARIKADLELLAEAQCGVRSEFDELEGAGLMADGCPTQSAVFEWIRAVVREDAMGLFLKHMTRKSVVPLARSQGIGEGWVLDAALLKR